jgi:hypothetical protein
MRRHPIYFLYGLLVLATVGAAELRGWTLLRATEVRNVPRSIRENPGAYRTIYRGGGRYMGGK